MTTIISAIIGFILCVIIICIVAFIMLGVVGYMIRHDLDFEDLADYMEDPEDTEA